MKVKVDFLLNSRFGVVERLVFRLVLNGFTDVNEIVNALPLFSDSVMANGIKILVNRQILAADIEVGKLYLSEPLVAIIDMCIENIYEIDIPVELETCVKSGGIRISGIANNNSRYLAQAVLLELLPGIRLDMYVDSIDFVLYEERGDQNE